MMMMMMMMTVVVVALRRFKHYATVRGVSELGAMYCIIFLRNCFSKGNTSSLLLDV